MKITTINDQSVNVNGTSLQGYVRTTLADLETKLGQAQDGCDKTTAEWYLQFEDGSVATIYDWKTDSTPLGLYDWHIGGHDPSVVDKVGEALKMSVFDYRSSNW
jgi:hypothetical protein